MTRCNFDGWSDVIGEVQGNAQGQKRTKETFLDWVKKKSKTDREQIKRTIAHDDNTAFADRLVR